MGYVSVARNSKPRSGVFALLGAIIVAVVATIFVVFVIVAMIDWGWWRGFLAETITGASALC